MRTTELTLRTGDEPTLVDLTSHCAEFVRSETDGLLNVFVPHATCGLVVLELGQGSDEDLLAALERLLPHGEGLWLHRHGSPGHGADHVLPLLSSPSLSLPVVKGQLGLGSWQSIALLDTNVDNPTRRVRLSFLPG
ncbi:MAG: YjbQ family protein [Chloroflexi bacterium]|nr:YjbQ family protein [Chloroflexota bacterium]